MMNLMMIFDGTNLWIGYDNEHLEFSQLINRRFEN